MKTITSSLWRALRASIWLFWIITMLSGCERRAPTPHAPVSNAKATASFWQVVEAPSPHNTLLTRLPSLSSNALVQQDVESTVAVLQQGAAVCRERVALISQQPLMGVDPEAAAFAAQKVRVLSQTAHFLDSFAQLLSTQASFTDGTSWFTDFLVASARHADDGSDVFKNAFKETVVGKIQTAGNLQPQAQAFVAEIQALAQTGTELQAAELETRAKLTARYGREFPTTKMLKQQNPPPAPQTLPGSNLSANRAVLMQNLLHHKITTPSGPCSFDLMSEYQTFDVIGGTNYGDVIDYEIFTKVKALTIGPERDFRVLMTYQNQNGAMQLMFVRAL